MARKSTGLELAHSIWSRRKWLAVAVWLWTLGAAATVTMALPNMYSATATLLVERQQVSEALVRSAVTGALETRLQTISQGILSRARLEELIVRFNLYPGLRPQGGSIEAAVGQMRRDVHVQPIGGGAPGEDATVAFSVSYDGWRPQQVADVAGVLASFYIDENLRMREEQASGTTRFLQVQLDQMKAQVDDRAALLNQFRQRYSWELSDQSSNNMATLDRRNAQLVLNAEAQQRALERRRSLASAEPERERERERVPDRAEVQLDEVRGELVALRARFTEFHPDVIRVRRQILALEEQVRAAAKDTPTGGTNGGGTNGGGTIGDGTNGGPASHASNAISEIDEIDAELASLRIEERSLRDTIAEYERRVESAPRREPEFQRLSRDYEAASETYYALLKRYEDARLAENLEQGHRGEYFRTLDPPLPPEQPVAPDRFRLLFMSFALSLGLAAAVATMADKLDASFHTVDDLRAFTPAPVAATIARIPTSADTRRRWWRVAAGIVVGVCVLALLIAGAWFFAHGNEGLVRLLARGR